MHRTLLTALLLLAALAPVRADDPIISVPRDCQSCINALEGYGDAIRRYDQTRAERDAVLSRLNQMKPGDRGYAALLNESRNLNDGLLDANNAVRQYQGRLNEALAEHVAEKKRVLDDRENSDGDIGDLNRKTKEESRLELAEAQRVREEVRRITDNEQTAVKNDFNRIRADLNQREQEHTRVRQTMCRAGLGGGCSPEDRGDLGNLDNRQAAQEHLDQILEDDPDNAKALSARALNNLNLGNKQAACRDADAALGLNPRDERARGISSMHCRGKLVSDMKLRGPDRRLAEDPDNLRPGRGPQLAGGQRPPGAPQGAPQGPPLMGLPSIPRNFGVHRAVNPQSDFESYEKLNEARALLGQKDLPGALDVAIEALRLNPRNAGAYALLSSIYRRAGDYQSALEAARRGLALRPNDPNLLKLKAYAQNRLGDAKGAAEAARRAIELNPTDAMAYALLARALGMMGDRKGMLKALRQAAAFDPRFARSLQEARNSDPSAQIPFYLPGEKRPRRAQRVSRKNKRRLLGMGLMLLGLAAGAMLMLFGRKKKQPAGEVPAGAAAGVFPVGQGAPTIQAGTANGLIGDKYQLGRKIGEGGMGMVFEAYDRKLERKVAIKQMRPELKSDQRGWEQFVQEARIVSHLSHPYIVGIHEMVEHGADTFLVFDYVDGKPLSKILAEKKRLPLNETRRIMSQVCEAIGFAHGKKVLHRDLKPANIMVDRGGYAKVMDFGIAREAKNTISRFTRRDSSGTPVYMAPEQHLGKAVQASDIFSLGVCLYEMLTGRLPYEGSDLLAQKERRAYPAPRQAAPDLPANADILIAAALEPDPSKRIADAAELSELLKDLK